MEIRFYMLSFLVSLALTGVYLFVWRKNYDTHMTMVFVLVPVANLSYLLMGAATDLEAALAVRKLSYMGGCFLQMIFMLAVFSLCRIKLNRWLRLLFMTISSVVYLSALTIGTHDWFYRAAWLEETEQGLTLIREYGVMHTVFYGLVIAYFLLSGGAIIYALLRKNQVSRKTLLLLALPELVCMIAFFGGRAFFPAVELIPAAYVFAQLVYLGIVYRISLYDVTETAVEILVQSGGAGFVTFDRHENYLGSNETARMILPGLEKLTVDFSLKHDPALYAMIEPWLRSFEAQPDAVEENRHFYEKDGKIYLFTVQWLPGKRHRGYQLFITDDTMDRAYIKLLDGYNSELEKQVAEKTAHLTEMHDQLVLGMATMVESRDNSTGGHIRRTSEGVRLLTEAMKALPEAPAGYPLDEDFSRDLIKAAPMHDLGKIAVDDDVLRKPGRFTPEEYEQMKAHAAEGARIVHEILKGTDDRAFRRIAENVAHYHHERWDGSGYPKGLRGTQIPPEARIMAVADVYDALVSKRVYKDSLPFDKADAIILDGMGSQFDPALRPVYEAARPRLEAYYLNRAEG